MGNYNSVEYLTPSKFVWRPYKSEIFKTYSSANEQDDCSSRITFTFTSYPIKKFEWVVHMQCISKRNVKLSIDLYNRCDDLSELSEDVIVDFELSYKDENQKIVRKCKGMKNAEKIGFASDLISDVFKRADLTKDNISDMDFSITCSINIPEYSVDEFTKRAEVDSLAERLFRNVISGNQDNTFADVIIICSDNTVYHVHSCYLADRSPVFKTMLENCQFKEAKERTVEIVDVEPEAIKEILRYIYTMTTSNSLKFYAPDVLNAIEKYDLPLGLKYACVAQLKENLSTETAIETLVVADRYRLPELKTDSIKMILQNINACRKQESWNELLKTRIDLVDELFASTVNIDQ